MKVRKEEIAGALLCLFLGILPSRIIGFDASWYQSIARPSFTPPSYIFAPVWTLLYLMIGSVAGRLYRKREKGALLLFGVLFLVNLSWPIVFFHFQSIFWAFWILSMLWGLSVAFMVYARADLVSCALFAPYLLWISFAWLLNLCLYRLNLT